MAQPLGDDDDGQMSDEEYLAFLRNNLDHGEISQEEYDEALAAMGVNVDEAPAAEGYDDSNIDDMNDDEFRAHIDRAFARRQITFWQYIEALSHFAPEYSRQRHDEIEAERLRLGDAYARGELTPEQYSDALYALGGFRMEYGYSYDHDPNTNYNEFQPGWLRLHAPEFAAWRDEQISMRIARHHRLAEDYRRRHRGIIAKAA